MPLSDPCYDLEKSFKRVKIYLVGNPPKDADGWSCYDVYQDDNRSLFFAVGKDDDGDLVTTEFFRGSLHTGFLDKFATDTIIKLKRRK